MDETKDYEQGLYIYFQKLSRDAIIPTRNTSKSAGLDLYSARDYTIDPHGKALCSTDLLVRLPSGYYGRIAPKSGLALYKHIDVGAGVVDEDYRGNVQVLLFNFKDVEYVVKKGSAIAQLICEKISYPRVIESNIDLNTERGDNGFGSSGSFS